MRESLISYSMIFLLNDVTVIAYIQIHTHTHLHTEGIWYDNLDKAYNSIASEKGQGFPTPTVGWNTAGRKDPHIVLWIDKLQMQHVQIDASIYTIAGQ